MKTIWISKIVCGIFLELIIAQAGYAHGIHTSADTRLWVQGERVNYDRNRWWKVDYDDDGKPDKWVHILWIYGQDNHPDAIHILDIEPLDYFEEN